ncbi:MAG: LamG domain-containing protein [Gemmatimonadota bacterium]|nr:MAG: LamG domain-containing protein [Gemmatimonadota bacterium]
MRNIKLSLLVIVVSFYACLDGQNFPLDVKNIPAASIEDGANNGNEHFYFLPPMVSQPSFGGTFNGSLAPEVRICQWDGTCAILKAEFTMTTGPGSETLRLVPDDELYVVNWHTDEFDLIDTETYRIIVSVDGQELGYADVDPVANGRELRNVDTEEHIALLDGRTLPIKFRIEEGALCIPPPADVVGWWPGDGNALDVAGENHGTLHYGATFTDGVVGQAFSFDGVDDYMSVPDNSSLRASGAITIDFWAYFNDVPRTADRYPYEILGKAEEPPADYLINWNPRTVDTDWLQAAALYFGIADNCDGKLHIDNYAKLPDLQAHEWHHIAVTAVDLGTTTEVHFYFDGETVPTIKHPWQGHWPCGWYQHPTGPLLFGWRHHPATERDHFDGLLDEVEIFDRALSAEEIKDIYQAGIEGKCKP